MVVLFILLIMAVARPYWLWNLRNHLWMTKSQFRFKQIIMSSKHNVKRYKQHAAPVICAFGPSDIIF